MIREKSEIADTKHDKLIKELFEEYNLKVCDIIWNCNVDGMILKLRKVGFEPTVNVNVSGLEEIQNTHYYNMADLINKKVEQLNIYV